MKRICALMLALGIGLAGPGQAQDACDFRLDRTKQFEATFKQLLLEQAEQTRGLWHPIRKADDEVKDLARFVGRLDVCMRTPDERKVQYTDPIGGFPVNSDKWISLCTASLLPGNRLITARHCFFDDRVARLGFTEIEAVQVTFGFSQTDFKGSVRRFDVATKELAALKDLDALVLQIEGDANAAMGGHVPLIMQTRLRPRESLLMIHHPIAQPLQYSSGTCAVAREQGDLPGDAPNLRHKCETFGGSSGALIFDAEERVVVGLHQGADVVKDSFGNVRDGFNIGFKFEPVNRALDLGFAPLSELERTLQGVPALRGLERKREVLTDILARYPGTKIAARADGMLKVLPERDLEAEADDALSDALLIADLDAQDLALAKVLREFPDTRAADRAQRERAFLRETRAGVALDAALALSDPANRRAGLEQIRRDFDGTRAARQAERELDRLKPKPKSREELATDRLIAALQITDAAAQRPLLEAVVSEFGGTPAAESAKAMLAKMAEPTLPVVSVPTLPVVSVPTLTVKSDGSGDYRTIAAAVAVAKAGTRIAIYPGTYKGGLVVDKELELVGIGNRDRINWEAFDESVIVWTASAGRVSNLRLRSKKSRSSGSPSIVFDGGKALLENCDIASKARAVVRIVNGADPVLRSNVIRGGGQTGVLVSNSGRGTLEFNEIFENRYAGVIVEYGGDPLIINNDITKNGSKAVVVRRGGKGKIISNSLWGYQFGAFFFGPDAGEVLLRDNRE